ncbi:MAG: ABC transporter substrate-binding protein [Lachnospiraceae bacterium]|nr:ABC transporter substrate-binding protein [Lachnospiraceae bacterium]
MKKRILSLLLASLMVVSLAACGSSSSTTSSSTETTTETTEETSTDDTASDETELVETLASIVADMDYYASSEYVYDLVLGEFYEVYTAAKENATTVSERYALMAVAEAKLLESGVMLPLYSSGGNYAISRLVTHTSPYANAGNDADRYYSMLVTEDFLKTEDVTYLRDLWNELRGTGTYKEEAEAYLTEQGYAFKNELNIIYTSDPQTYDDLASSKSVDHEVLVNTYDGLLEYDCEGVQQPALATGYEVSDDGLTWTFYIREGVKWVDSQGREIAEVVADDWVAGLQHCIDTQSGLGDLLDGIVEGVGEYISGEITDFSQVGVEAVDDYTLVYHLIEPCTYFNTMVGYSLFAPLCRTYYESMGGKFGAEYDASASDYLYGKDKDSIVYCGPYIITNATATTTIIFTKNESYWNIDNVTMDTITWRYDDGSDASKTYTDTLNGDNDSVTLNASRLELAKADGIYDTYAYISSTTTTSYMAFYNVNRQVYANTNDGTLESPNSEEERARTYEAMALQSFRLALSYATDRGAYFAQTKGEDLKYASIRNTYTPGDFVFLEEDVTIDISGTATTFPAGTYYGEIVQAQLDADGSDIVAWDGTSSDLFDGWYNPDAAVEQLEIAIEELAAMGIVVDEDNPIYIDYPYYSGSETYSNRAEAYKQSIENTLGGKVIVNKIEATVDQWYYAGYYTESGAESNYEMYDLSGWGPDYVDPSTYLDTMLPDGSGYMTKSLGLW